MITLDKLEILVITNAVEKPKCKIYPDITKLINVITRQKMNVEQTKSDENPLIL